MNRFEVGLGIFLALLINLSQQRILPCHYIPRLDLRNLPVFEIRHNLCPEDMLLGIPRVLLESWLQVCNVLLAETPERHTQ